MASDPSDNGLNAGLAQTAYPEVAPGQWNSAAQAWQLPDAATTVVRPSKPLSDDRLFDLGVISPEEYQRRTGRLSPYTGLQSGLFPRTQAALNSGAPYLQQAVGAGMDLASLPGRAYASLGGLPNETYAQALARVSSPESSEKAYQIADNMFRDPSTALIPLGLGLAGKLPAVASGIEALGTAGRVGLDAAANTVAQMGNEYSETGTTSNPLGSGLMNAAMDVGVRGMGGLGSKIAGMISPEESAANFKRWFAGSKAVDDSYGKPVPFYHGTSNSGFDVFDATANGGKGLMGEGAYFTSNPDVASGYAAKGNGASPGVYKTYLSIKNPIDMDAKPDAAQWEKMFPGISDYIGNDWKPNKNEDYLNAFTEMAKDNGLPDYEATQALREGFEGAGYDGLTHIGGGRYGNKTTPPHKVFIAFDPTQIKSAIGNSGAWDPNNPDIADLIPLEQPKLSKMIANKGGISPEESKINFDKWFGESKVVDDAGNPLTVYHGTDQSFDSFDPSKLGALTGVESAKKGFFFTDNPENAGFYAGWTPSKEGYDYVNNLVNEKKDRVNNIESAIADLRRGRNRKLKVVDNDDASMNDEDLLKLGYSKDEISLHRTRENLLNSLADATNELKAAQTLGIANSIGRNFKTGMSPNIMPVNLNIDNPLIHNQNSQYRDITFSDLIDQAKNAGNNGVIIRGTEDPLRGSVYIPFDPTQIKSSIGNRGTWDPSDPNITHLTPGLSVGAFPSFATLLANRVNNTARQAAMQQGQQIFGGQQ